MRSSRNYGQILQTKRTLDTTLRPWLTWCCQNKYPELNLKGIKRNDTHTHTHRDIHTLTIASHTLVIVTDTHQHIDRGLYTYMTSYLAQAYRLSILIDKPTLFINGWLIRLSVDNVLLINTRSLSIVIDKTIPLSIGISNVSHVDSSTLVFSLSSHRYPYIVFVFSARFNGS